MKNLQQAGNNHHEKLLKQDAKFQLSEVNASFRQELLLNRMEDPSYANIPIPYLTAELIDAEISAFYVDWLEDVHRKEVYKKTMAAVSQDKLSEKKDSKKSEATVQDHLTDECKARRQAIFDKIHKRKKIKDSGDARYKEASYDSVVNEFKFEADDLTIFDLIRNFFKTGRRLKPVVK